LATHSRVIGFIEHLALLEDVADEGIAHGQARAHLFGRPDEQVQGERRPGPAAPTAPLAAGTDWKALFDASCDLASLAAGDPDAVLGEGLRILVRATHAVRGAVFTRGADARRLEARVSAGEPGGPQAGISDAERSAAACALGSDAASVVHLAGRDARGTSRPPGAGERPGMVIALPLRMDAGPVGAVCLACRQEAAPDRAALDALERLVGALARAYEAAGRQRG
jgi:hypothetical protein